MADSDLGAWLRQQREDRGWSKSEMARRLVQAGRDADDKSMPGVDGVLHNIHRWEREGGISERHKLHYCRAFGIRPGQFGPGASGDAAGEVGRSPAAATPGAPTALVPAQRPAAVPGLPGLIPPTAASIAYGGRREPVSGEFTVRQEVMMAAHEGSDHAAEHEQYGIGEATLEQLHTDLARLSVLSSTGSPFPAFQDMRQVRDRVFGYWTGGSGRPSRPTCTSSPAASTG